MPAPRRSLQTGRRVTGVEYLHDGQLKSMQADAVLLATGGAGQLFAQTTNPSVATADGLALAWRAGAAVADLEFFQFHPTCLVRPDEAASGRRRPGPAADLRGRPRRRRHPRGRPGPPVHARLPPRRRTRPAGRRLPQHCPAPCRARRPQRPRLPRRPRHRGRQGSGLPGEALPHHHAPHPRGRHRLDPGTRPRRPGRPLLDGRRRPPTCTAAPPCPGSSPPAKSPAPGSRAPTGWPATRSSKGWSSGGGLLRRSCAIRRIRRALIRQRSRQGGGRLRPWARHDPGSLRRRLRGHVGDRGGARGGLPVVESGRGSAQPGPFSRGALRRLMTAQAGVLRTGGQLREAGAALAAWAAVVRPESVPDVEDPREHEDANLLLAAQLLVRAARERRDVPWGALPRRRLRRNRPSADDLDEPLQNDPESEPRP